MAGELTEGLILQWYSGAMGKWLDFSTHETKEELLEEYNRQVDNDDGCQYQAICRIEEVIAGPQT